MSAVSHSRMNLVTGAPPSSAGDESVASRYAAWNPRLNPRDRAHLAPIVTPAHPTMNSSYNVGAPQLRAIQDELKRGVEATRRRNPDTAPLVELWRGAEEELATQHEEQAAQRVAEEQAAAEERRAAKEAKRGEAKEQREASTADMQKAGQQARAQAHQERDEAQHAANAPMPSPAA